MQTIRELQDVVARAGRVEWIGLRPVRREVIKSVAEVAADPGFGLAGDH